jgi:predicted acetyltransferase
MSNDLLRLVEPTLSLRDEFYSLAEEFLADGDSRYQDAMSDFEGFIQQCSDEAAGRNLASGRIPQSTFLARPRRQQNHCLFPITPQSEYAS